MSALSHQQQMELQLQQEAERKTRTELQTSLKSSGRPAKGSNALGNSSDSLVNIMTERTAPQLLFDDGSRVIEQASAAAVPALESPRGSISVSKYYEIERLASEIVQLMTKKKQNQTEINANDNNKSSANSDFFVRVALQFPDELLSDSPEVCWAMEEALERMQESTVVDSKNATKDSLVFCLGDTTFGPCCPDEVAALHLKADVLVHYGHACLSHPPLSLPVLYSFGVTEHWDTQACIDVISGQVKKEGVRRLLLLYQVKYQHAVEDLQTQLSEKGDILLVVGEIPQEPVETLAEQKNSDMQHTCCSGGGGGAGAESCVSKITTGETNDGTTTEMETPCDKDAFLIGGLQIPKNLDFSSFAVVFIGDQTSDGQSQGMRQYMNTALWYLSTKSKPMAFWAYCPLRKVLETSVPSGIQRQLNRRFYLIQKARDASIFGILIGTLSQRYFRSVVNTLRKIIQDNGRSQYTFAMGKVNPAKIANFAEIDCFIMVACAETSWLDEAEQREMHVPIITPLELHMALGSGGPEVQWGECDYSLDYTDFLSKYQNRLGEDEFNHEPKGISEGFSDDHASQLQDEVTDGEDAPYFSLITGKYESAKKSNAEDIDLKALPGKGQLTTYKSEAAEFLKQREYRGLEAQIGETEVHTAVPGQQGIASKYNNDVKISSNKGEQTRES